MSTTKFKGETVTLIGDEIKIGMDAPVASLVDTALNDVEVGGKSDKIQLIISVPSLETKVCAAETRKFNQEVANLSIVDTTVISMDLPFASERFCSTEGIANLKVASDYVDKDFATSYGVLMGDGKLRGLCARAVFVVDRKGKIVYKEIVADVTSEPNYSAVLDAIKGAR